MSPSPGDALVCCVKSGGTNGHLGKHWYRQRTTHSYRVPAIGLWWPGTRRHRLVVTPLVTRHIGACIHHNRENTNRFRKVFWSFLCYRRVFSRLHPRLFRGVTPDRRAGGTLSCLPGLHIPATRWIGILSKESPDRCGACAIRRTA